MKSDLEGTMYNRPVACSLMSMLNCKLRESFVHSRTPPFVGLEIGAEEYDTLYLARHLAAPVYFTWIFKAQGQLACKLADASDTCGVS